MATDDERRRVAERLREYASFDCECEDDEDCLVDCADWGERVLNLLDCGASECECYAYLADLIDPDTTSDTTTDTTKSAEDTTKAPNSHPNLGTAEANASQVPECDMSPSCRDTVACDREALLALADELETDGVDCYNVSTQYVCDQYARRIREACGVLDAG